MDIDGKEVRIDSEPFICQALVGGTEVFCSFGSSSFVID